LYCTKVHAPVYVSKTLVFISATRIYQKLQQKKRRKINVLYVTSMITVFKISTFP